MRLVKLALVCGLLASSAPSLSAQQYLFGRAQFPTAPGPVALVTGDFDGDSYTDIATANSNGTVSVLYGNPDGTFKPHVDFKVGHNPTSIAFFPPFFDDQPVLAVTNGDDNTVSLLFIRNSQRLDYPTGVQPSSVIVDYDEGGGRYYVFVVNKNCRTNNDGRCDGHTGSVSVYAVNSDLTLQPPVEYPAGIAPVQMALGELNGDFTTDIAVANEVPSPKSITMLFGKGEGVFGPPVSRGDTGGARAVAIGRDEEVVYTGVGTSAASSGVYLIYAIGQGAYTDPRVYYIPGAPAPAILRGHLGSPLLDLAVGSSQSVAVLLGSENDYLLGAPSFYAGGPGEVLSIASADFNGDGRPDLAFVSQGLDAVTVLVGGGAGNFSPQADYTTVHDPLQLVAADFNDDLKLDLASVNSVNGGPGSVSIFLNAGNGALESHKDYAAGTGSVSLTSADFNHDGRQDVAVANDNPPNPGSFSLLLGNGDGTLKPHADYATGYGPRSVAQGDFNKDGKPDLVIADAGDATHPGSTVSVHLGKGDGTFSGPVAYAAGKVPVGIFIADFNNDGNPDIAVANRSDKTVSVLLGDGNGTFRPHVDYPAANNPLEYPDSIAGGDFHGDGRIDLIVGADNSVKLLAGNGNGGFAAPITIAAAAGANPVVSTADINHDGKLDVLIAEYPTAEVQVLLGNGDGTFRAPLYYQGSLHGVGANLLPESAESTLAADLNGDGLPDLAIANAASGSGIVSTYLNQAVVATHPSSLEFNVERVGTTSGAQSVRLYNPSAVPLKISSITTSQNFRVTNRCGPTVAPGASCTVFVAFSPQNTACCQDALIIQDNAFGGPQTIPLSGLSFNSPVAQINGPLVPDSLAPGHIGFTLTVNGMGFAPQAIILWNGNPRPTNFVSPIQLTASISQADIAHAGTAWVSVINPLTEPSNTVPFQIAVPVPAISPSRQDVPAGINPRAVAVADFNHDGKQDMAVANFSAGTVSIFLGNGDGTFQAHRDFAVGVKPVFIAVADLDADGKLDLAVANFGSNNVSILLGKGDGTFQPGQNYPVGAGPSSIAVGDFEHDGRQDLAITNYSANTLSILVSEGQGTFINPNSSDYPVGTSPISVASGNFNGDDYVDLAVANYGSNDISLLILRSDTLTFRTLAPIPTGATPRAIVAVDLNGDGRQDIATANYAPNTVSVLLNSGPAAFAPHVDYPTGLHPFALVAADLNSDGIPDLAVADTYCSTTCPPYGYLSVLLGNGDGTLQHQKAYVVGSQPVAIAAGDFNGDGRPDLATADFRSDSVTVLLQ